MEETVRNYVLKTPALVKAFGKCEGIGTQRRELTLYRSLRVVKFSAGCKKDQFLILNYLISSLRLFEGLEP